MITADALAARLADLELIGLDGAAGTTRLAWSSEDAAARRWFERQADALGRRAERDPAGNLWACPAEPAPWWGVGSHLDTVRNGGRFDGALGVAVAFEVAARSATPVAVISFADEEGARFNTPTFGSRALAGHLDVDDVLGRRDDDGTLLGDAMAAAGVPPAGLQSAAGWLDRLRGFLEVHIDQSRDVARADAPAGVVTALATRVRLAVELRGEADHAGTTTREERRDALAAAARLIVGADELAEGEDAFVVTASRILVKPNALTTVPSRVRLWLDARAPRPEPLDRWLAGVAEVARALAARTGVSIDVATQSSSPGVAFDAGVREALAGALGASAPAVVCFAGHDAGVLGASIPAGMVLVRNPTGVSHSPAERVDLADAAVAAGALVRALEVLA